MKKKKKKLFPWHGRADNKGSKCFTSVQMLFFFPKFSSKAKTNKHCLNTFFFSKISPKLKQTTKQKHHEEFLYKYTKL